MIRRCDDSDATRCSEIVCACADVMGEYTTDVQAYLRVQFDPVRIAEKLRSNDHAVVNVKRGEVVGLGAFGDGRVKMVYVQPSLHGNGIGSEIMDELEGFARKSGHTTIHARSSYVAESFYRKRGYSSLNKETVVVDGYTLPFIVMVKRLSDFE